MPIEPNPTEELAEKLQAALTDEALGKFKKKLQHAVIDVCQDVEYNLQDSLANSLAFQAEQQADAIIAALLSGDESEMRRHLKCPVDFYTGRDGRHSVIRGELFETGGIALRHRIVDLHADLLKTERVLDLEDQVKSLTTKVAALENRIEQIYKGRA